MVRLVGHEHEFGSSFKNILSHLWPVLWKDTRNELTRKGAHIQVKEGCCIEPGGQFQDCEFFFPNRQCLVLKVIFPRIQLQYLKVTAPRFDCGKMSACASPRLPQNYHPCWLIITHLNAIEHFTDESNSVVFVSHLFYLQIEALILDTTVTSTESVLFNIINSQALTKWLHYMGQ